MKDNLPSEDEFKDRGSLPLQILIFFVTAAVIISLSFYTYRHKYYASVVENINSELEAVSVLKMENIIQWRNERIRNLIVLQNPAFGDRVRETLEKPDDKAVQKEMYDWLIRFDRNYGYERSCIHDMNGNEIVKTDDEQTEMIAEDESLYERLFVEKKVLFGELYQDSLRKSVYIPVIAGMFDYYDGVKPLGFMISRINPQDYLYPMLNSWPVPRETAESFLVRREGEVIKLLNNCSNDGNSALNMEFKLSDHPEMPAVKAVKGSQGIVAGKNYSGKEVFAFVNKVPETEWFLVSKIDSEEALVPARTASKTISIIALLAIFLSGTGILFTARSQKYRYYKKLAAKSRELAESEANLRITLSSIGDGVIVTDPDGKVTMLNKTAEQMTGWINKDAKDKDIRDVFKIINAYTRQEVLNPVKVVIGDGRTVGLANHTILISKDGTEYQIADSAAPIIDKNGEIHGMILVFSDVTEKYKAQEHIAENERFLDSLITNLNGMVYRCSNDEKWSMIYTTGGSEDITGYKPEEFISGKIRYSDIVFPEDIRILKDAIDTAIRTKEHFSVEYRLTDKNGKHKWVLEKGKAVYDEKGELQFIEGFVTDITLTKTSEIRIREKSAELERMNNLMIDRELRMIDLKKEINILLKDSGKDEKYKIIE
jgi:PAS domain S-box-containing protein